jgi:hypothetical protein
MRSVTYVILLLATSMSASWLFAAEPAPATATKPEQTAAPEKKADAGKADVDKDAEKPAVDADAKDGDEKSAADKSGDKAGKASPQRFIPSEQVRADFDVSFPVDI